MSKKHIIVTGGAGFIASHVVDAYIAAGHRVIILDDLSTGFRHNLNPKAKFYKADIRDRERILSIFRKEKPDVVNHHAARISVVESARDPLPTYETNVLGTANLVLAFGKYHRRGGKFIFASTGGAIYGNPKHVPADENTPALPLAPYGLSKLLAEQILKFHAASFGFDYTILRYANVYGPRQNPKGEAGVVAIFDGLIASGKKPSIFGDGSKTRDYIYVGDIVHANALALHKGNNDTVNIGTGRFISDKRVFDAIAIAHGFRMQPRFAPFRPGEVQRIALDARRAKKIMGWMSKTDFETGIRETVAKTHPGK